MSQAAPIAPSASLPLTAGQEQDRPSWLPYAEVLTVLVLAAASLWAVRPLLEEWGLFRAYNAVGLGYQVQIFPLLSMRPLHLTPSALQWLVGGGQVWGVGIVAALMLVARYYVVRWAVTPVLSPTRRWAFATACTVLIGWPALWLARFHPAQLTATLLFVLLGLSIRLSIRRALLPYILGALSFCALLMVYQALALLVLTLPILACLWVPPGQSADMRARLRRSARTAVMVGLGAVLYAAYVLVIYVVMDGAYEVSVVTGSAQTGLTALLRNIPLIYKAAFERSPESLGLLIMLLCIAAHALNRRGGAAHAVLGILAVLCLPLLSLIYLNPVHIQDPERIMFPIACGAVVVLFGLFALSVEGSDGRPIHIVFVGALLVSGLVSASEARGRWNFQKDLAKQVAELAATTGSREIALRDETGLLGGMYTFFEGILSDAVAVSGVEVRVGLCTSSGVDRLYRYTNQYPLIPRCSGSGEQNPQVLQAVARIQGERIVIERAVPRGAGQ
ncbi:hypothetical protein VQH23_08090 [Pararoseomonas sp. SCSIO 73927]|uniref:hypothetical protein n=1 Tax=Pararoseomonas sp. SCSIO 73927 TaxID=3114537 RepID=UPI0030D2C004